MKNFFSRLFAKSSNKRPDFNMVTQDDPAEKKTTEQQQEQNLEVADADSDHLTSRDKAKKIFVAWSKEAPFQCYPKIFEYKSVTPKLLWTWLFLLLTSSTYYIVHRSVAEYLQRSVVSQIEILNEQEPEFPAVTICDSNMFATKFAEGIMQNISLETFPDQSDSLERLKQVLLLTKLRVTNKDFPDWRRRLLGFDMKQIAGFGFDNQMHASQRDVLANFRWVFEFDYGSCVQFNSGFDADNRGTRVRVVEVQGPMYGLKVFIDGVDHENHLPVAESNGFKIFVHNKTFMPR